MRLKVSNYLSQCNIIIDVHEYKYSLMYTESLCSNPFHVSKYPTMKLMRYGEVARKEYRGKVSLIYSQCNTVKPLLVDPP